MPFQAPGCRSFRPRTRASWSARRSGRRRSATHFRAHARRGDAELFAQTDLLRQAVSSGQSTQHSGLMPVTNPTAPERQLGGCQCGNIRYSAPAAAEALYVCHCSECRRQSSSAFGISYTVDRNSLEIFKGSPSFWYRTTASGHRLECAFCSNCGSRLWHQSTGHATTLNIKAGSLDQPVDLSEAIHIWVSSKLPGVIIPDGAVSFAREPT